MGHRLLDRARGDLGEHHPLQGLAFEQAALAQDLGDVPADRLALAVRVGRQEQRASARFRRLGDRLDMLLVLLDQVVAHGEAVGRVDRAFLRHQVADMAVGGQDGEVLAEVLVDRLGLGGRFDDQEVLGHGGGGLCAAAAAREGRPGSREGNARGRWPRAFGSSLFKWNHAAAEAVPLLREGSAAWRALMPGRLPVQPVRARPGTSGFPSRHRPLPSRAG